MKKPYIFPLLLGSLVLTGCANGQIDAMQMRLNQQEQQIRLLNSQLSGVQPAQADTWAQVQSLRQEMSAVKGQIDDFNNATAAAGGLPGLAQRVNNHEAALQAIATQFGMELPVAAVPGAPGAAPGMPDATAAAPVPAAPVMQPQVAAPAPQQAAPQTQAQGDIANLRLLTGPLKTFITLFRRRRMSWSSGLFRSGAYFDLIAKYIHNENKYDLNFAGAGKLNTS